MVTENKLILVVDRFDNDLELLTNRIDQSADDYDQILILHSEKISQEILASFSSHVDFEFLSRGVLPSSISRVLSPVFLKVSRACRHVTWKARKLWATRDYYFRKSITKFFKLFELIRRYIFKMILVFGYKIVMPILALIISIFVEWPIALLISWIPSKSDHNQNDLDKQGMFSKIRQRYYSIRYEIYMKRLKRIQQQHESADFEYINLMNSDS